MEATVLFASAVTPRRFTGVPNVRRKAMPSIKKISPFRCMSLPAGLDTVMTLSGVVDVCVVLPLRMPSGVPYISLDLLRL